MRSEDQLKYYDTQIDKLKTRLADLKKDHHNTLRLARRLQQWVNAKARAA